MSEEKMNLSRTIAAWTQVAVFVIGLGSLAISLGRKDRTLEYHSEQLAELKSITGDMVRSQLSLTGNYQVVAQRITELERRLNIIHTQ